MELNPPLQNSASPRQQEPDSGDLEKLRKWQEERITRKLRGEYESAVLHLSELVSRLHPDENASSDLMSLGQLQPHDTSENLICARGGCRKNTRVVSSLVDQTPPPQTVGAVQPRVRPPYNATSQPYISRNGCIPNGRGQD